MATTTEKVEAVTDVDDRDAWVAWSALAEPTDQAAQWLVERYGPVVARDWALGTARDLPESQEPVAPAALQHAPATPQHAPATPQQTDKALAARERWQRRASQARPSELRDRAQACGATIIHRTDAGWPAAFDDLGGAAPFVLWVRGDADVAGALAQGIAVVGARATTAYGEHMAAGIASGLTDAGRPVISGGAYGIDARAHRAALAVDGTTVAFLAGGVDRLYPAGNADLLTEVIRNGAVVSEAPPGFAPHRSRFLARNRLIAAAAATVVVEAAHRSGALSTARHAHHMARPVAAVPGPATSASSTGCHRLIRDNEAVLVTSASDVLELVAPLQDTLDLGFDDHTPSSGLEFAHPHDRAAYDACGGRALPMEAIAATAGLTLAEVLASMGRLELAGAVERSGAAWRRATRRYQKI